MATAIAVRPISKVAAHDFARDLDLTDDELHYLLDLTERVKRAPSKFTRALSGKYISLLFEKPSLRTRLTFELAIKQLGGDSVTCEGPVGGGREPLKDVARNLDRWVNGIVARTFLQSTIEALAEWSSAPVINALSDMYHPCQALADVFTLREQFGELRGIKLAFVGDGNNVAHSLLLAAACVGGRITVASPPGYEPKPEVVGRALVIAARTGATIEITNDAVAAVAGAAAVYTDVWASMGQESEAAERRVIFAPYQVNETLMALAAPDALFMHCLPAHRGEEVTAGVMDSPQSIVFDQAENRLHVQKAILLLLLGGAARRFSARSAHA